MLNNAIKENFLDIPREILQEFGAVSSEVVSLMALNIKSKFIIIQLNFTSQI